MLVPAFASKGFSSVRKIIQTMSEFIADPVLISAYDLHISRGKVKQASVAFAPLVFLDSGGYEASTKTDLSDTLKTKHDPLRWTVTMHSEVLKMWNFSTPTVLISYDHPGRRETLEMQLAGAMRLFARYPAAVAREILLKPEPGKRGKLDIEAIVGAVERLGDVEIVGLTEKELGRSTFERMVNIARLRIALRESGKDKPIHVFGSLDPISTPLYFLSGADIFDGLTWLRFAFRDRFALYKHNYGAVELDISTPDDLVNGHIWSRNYHYMADMQGRLRQYLLNGDFEVFGPNGPLLRSCSERVLESVGG